MFGFLKRRKVRAQLELAQRLAKSLKGVREVIVQPDGSIVLRRPMVPKPDLEEASRDVLRSMVRAKEALEERAKEPTPPDQGPTPGQSVKDWADGLQVAFDPAPKTELYSGYVPPSPFEADHPTPAPEAAPEPVPIEALQQKTIAVPARVGLSPPRLFALMCMGLHSWTHTRNIVGPMVAAGHGQTKKTGTPTFVKNARLDAARAALSSLVNNTDLVRREKRGGDFFYKLTDEGLEARTMGTKAAARGARHFVAGTKRAYIKGALDQ